MPSPSSLRRVIRDYARFVQACVGRYRQRIKTWEIWNEPNISFFRGSAAEYAELVKAGAVAARHGDPTCRIAMGCAGVDLPFLRQLYEYGCGPFFDVMSVHPYQWGAEFNDGWMIQKLADCRRLMEEQGDNAKEIWATEYGWSTGEGIGPDEQAHLLAQALVTFLSVRERLGVEKSFWFCVKDWGGPGHGLFGVDGRPKPALAAYRAVTTALQDARYAGVWPVPEGVRGHLFVRAGQPVLVLWTAARKGQAQVRLEAGPGKVLVRTVTDTQHEVPGQDGKVLVPVSHAPVFVTGFRMGRDLPRNPARPAPLPRPSPADVWLSVIPPASTDRPFLVLGGHKDLPVKVHNDGTSPARVEVRFKLQHGPERLAAGTASIDVPPQGVAVVPCSITLPSRPDLAGQLAVLALRAGTGPQTLAPIHLPVRLVRSEAIEFLANSWTEQAYLHGAGKSGCAESVRFGDEFGYRFDLRKVKSARLSLLVGANGGKDWSVFVSTDDRQYRLECSGKSWPGWHTISMDRYLAGSVHDKEQPVFIKIRGADCQVREVILETETEGVPGK